jgi:hypothetical protein
MQMQDLFNGFFDLIGYNQQRKTMGCMVDHIHLDKNTFSILFQKGTICSSLLIILFDSDCVHIYGNNLNLIRKQTWVSNIYLFIRIHPHTHKVIQSRLMISHLIDY